MPASARRTRRAEVRLIFGARGAGKTHYARQVVAGAGRVLIFDPVAEWSTWPEVEGFATVAELHARACQLWHRPRFRLALTATGDLPRQLHRLARLAWIGQDNARDELLVVVDECQLGYGVQALPRELWAMPRVVLQGRHRRIGVLAISQRPALVSTDLRGNAHRATLFRLPGAVDRRAVAQQFGDGVADRCRALPDRQYLEVGAAGDLPRARANPPRRSRAA